MTPIIKWTTFCKPALRIDLNINRRKIVHKQQCDSTQIMGTVFLFCTCARRTWAFFSQYDVSLWFLSWTRKFLLQTNQMRQRALKTESWGLMCSIGLWVTNPNVSVGNECWNKHLKYYKTEYWKVKNTVMVQPYNFWTKAET